jgi:hypothetical protein
MTGQRAGMLPMVPTHGYSKMSSTRPTDSIFSGTTDGFACELRPRPMSGFSSHEGSSGVDMPLVPPEFAGPHSDTQPENLDFPSPKQQPAPADIAPLDSLPVMPIMSDWRSEGPVQVSGREGRAALNPEHPSASRRHAAPGDRSRNPLQRNIWH